MVERYLSTLKSYEFFKPNNGNTLVAFSSKIDNPKQIVNTIYRLTNIRQHYHIFKSIPNEIKCVFQFMNVEENQMVFIKSSYFSITKRKDITVDLIKMNNKLYNSYKEFEKDKFGWSGTIIYEIKFVPITPLMKSNYESNILQDVFLNPNTNTNTITKTTINKRKHKKPKKKKSHNKTTHNDEDNIDDIDSICSMDSNTDSNTDSIDSNTDSNMDSICSMDSNTDSMINIDLNTQIRIRSHNVNDIELYKYRLFWLEFIKISFNMNTSFYINDKMYITKMIIGLYESNPSFANKTKNYTHLCIVKSLHYDNLDKKEGHHFNAYLYDKYSNTQTDTLHFYVEFDTIVNITVIKHIITDFI